MAGKIDIFTLNIDVDAAIQSQSELKTRLDATKIGLESLKKQGDTTSQAFVEQEAKVKNLNREYNAAQTQLGKLINIQGQEIKTIEQGRNALTIINKEWAKQASLFGTNSKEADALAKKHLELKKRVNELQKGVGDTSGNIGNYSADIQDALGKTNLFSKGMAVLTETQKIAKPVYNALRTEALALGQGFNGAMVQAQGFTAAQKASTIASALGTAALKTLKLALVSTGIGAIVVLLGSLVAWFTKTQRGVDFVSKSMAFLGAAIAVVVDRLSSVIDAFIRLFETGDIVGFFGDMEEAASGLGDEMKREARLAYELEEALTTLQDREIALIGTQAARKQKIEELRLAAKDELTDLRERANLLQQAGDIEKAALADNIAIAKEKARISQQQLDLGESTREQVKENAELQARVIELDTESLKLQRSIEAEKQGLLKRARAEEETAAKAREALANKRMAEAKKATDEAIKESKTRLDIFIAENEGLGDQLAFEEKVRDEKIKLVEREVEAEKKTVSEGELAKLQIKQAFLERQKDIAIEFATEELEIYLNANQSRLEAEQTLTDELVAKEVERLEGIKAANEEFQADRLAQGDITQREYNTLIQQIDEEFRLAKNEKQTELAEQNKEAEIIELEAKREAAAESFDYDLALQQEYLDRKKAQEIQEAESVGANTADIEAKYADASKEIAQTVRDNKVSLAADAFGNLATILGKESKAGKAAAVAQTTITTFQSATNAFNSLSGIPIVGPALGAIAAAAAIAAGFANVKKIVATPTPTVKAEKGMLMGIGGNRHSGGGTKFRGEDGTTFEAERGELIGVMNRRAAQAFMGYNNQYVDGGTSVPNYFAQGGFINRNLATTGAVTPSQGFDYNLLTASLTDSIRQLPAPVTDVKDVIGQVGSYNKIVQGANI